MTYSRILVRATNWVGDAVMSLPALRSLRAAFPDARIDLLARPWVGGLYAKESCCDRIIPYAAAPGARDLRAKWRAAADLRAERYDCAFLMANAFEPALLAFLAGIPSRIGYNRDGRGFLLTTAVPPPRAGEIPRHQRFYYLEMLRRAGIIDSLPEVDAIRFEQIEPSRKLGVERFAELGMYGRIVGVSPGAAYGGAKRWLPERFAEAAATIASARGAGVAVFGSVRERPVCGDVAARVRALGVDARSLAGQTPIEDFMELAAACRLFLTNDSGAMHIASALGVPTVAVFGATDDSATGPTGPLARVIRVAADCAPCLLRECPIDHRCMTGISAARVAEAGLELFKW